MYKLMIVEDEKAIANGIANSLPWEEWGFEISGVLGNGAEALEAIAGEIPDVVLSDIRMPIMDGLELMQHLNRDHPDIRILILSGYNDFEYLQTAIKNGVCEYLLKPTDIDEFQLVFKRMKEKLDEDRERKRSYEEGITLREEKKFNALLKGYGYNEEEMEQEFYGEEEGSFGVMFFHIDGMKREDKKKNYHMGISVVDSLEEIRVREHISGKFFLNYEERITGILMLPGEQEEETLRDYAGRMIRHVKAHTDISVSVGISSFYLDYQMLPQCYQQAKCCASQRIFNREKQQILYYEEMREADFNYYTISFNADKIMEYMLEQNREKILEELDNTFSAFQNRVISDYDYINRLSLELMFNISRKLLRCSVQMEKVMKRLECTYSDIYTRDNLEDKRDFIYGILVNASEECKAMKGETKKRSGLAAAIREIVDSEFDSNRISLEYVAGKVHKNTAYISKIFKNEFECNFSDYVTRKRLERSRELLKDPALKIYEISDALGWADVSNYIKVFKKKYGISPNEYRRIAENTGGYYPKGEDI